MTRTEVLEAAREKITGSRQNSYGEPEDRFTFIAELWTAYLTNTGTRRKVTPLDVALMMSLLKIARTYQNPDHSDSLVDLCGYGAIASELSER